MVTAGQMGYGINAAKNNQVDEEFDIQMDQFGQAHLARQDTTNSELGMLKQQQQQLMQQMSQMCQQMNMAASNPPPTMQQMQFQPQQFQQQQQSWAKPKKAKKTRGYGQAAQNMGANFGGNKTNVEEINRMRRVRIAM